MQKMIILILSLFLFGACSDRPFPVQYVYVVDVQHSVCSKNEIIDQAKLIFKHIEDLPLAACDGNVSIAKDDFPSLKKWIIWAEEKAQQCAAAIKKVMNLNNAE